MGRNAKAEMASPKHQSCRSDQAPAGPFDKDVWRRATALAADYWLIIRRKEGGGYLCKAMELPGVFAEGKTEAACAKAAREGLAVTVAAMLEQGLKPPAPAGEKKRQEQINIRLTVEEKYLLEEAARRNGFKGISDFVRTVALDRVA